ncbi:hypothetical protein [Amycolatopsis speibonae]|uniref:Uncharacterized protein n=1 Tax=Amycolatopsis speibonae TaxID=1450224 RepID=A0ABV7NT16_9PSEU
MLGAVDHSDRPGLVPSPFVQSRQRVHEELVAAAADQVVEFGHGLRGFGPEVVLVVDGQEPRQHPARTEAAQEHAQGRRQEGHRQPVPERDTAPALARTPSSFATMISTAHSSPF